MKHIIIGGVAGGATAAARIRRIDENAEIILVEKGAYISYANCGLPYYLGGVIRERSRLFVQTPEAFSQRFRVDVRVNSEAIGIDSKAQTVAIRRSDGSTYTEHYDRLLLSPGAHPIRPALPGIDSEGIFVLRSIDDTDAIAQHLSTHDGPTVVVGAGFIGLEMAENLRHRGLSVTLVERDHQVMPPIDSDMAAYLHETLTQNGVALRLGVAVTGFTSTAQGLQVALSDGTMLEAQTVILSIGVAPNTELAKQAGIKVGQRGIVVNSYLKTSVDHIYAVGDAIEYPHPLTGQPWCNLLAGPANRQARIVADNMVCGDTVAYEGSIGTAIAKVFDLTVATTGLAAKQLRGGDTQIAESITTSAHHAGYYPDSSMLTTKLVFNAQSGQLLGATVIGRDGVGKRIDQLAMTIKHSEGVEALTRVEQAYAPPYSSAKDPVAIAGYVAGNILSGRMPTISWQEIGALSPDTQLIDVRTPDEYALGTIEGAINMPLDELRCNLDRLDANRPIVVFCQIGLRGYLAQQILKAHGMGHARNLIGGYKHYRVNTAVLTPRPQPVVTSSTPVEPPSHSPEEAAPMLEVDACGLACPGPILQLKKAMDTLSVGQRLRISATDAGFRRDARAWVQSTGNHFISEQQEGSRHVVVIEKGAHQGCTSTSTVADSKTLILFSSDLDKAIATFILANGAAATGKKVSVFFTFWGLNVIKKRHKPHVKKDFLGRMFSWMLPAHSGQLHLSKMSMFGMGDRLIRFIMKRNQAGTLETLIEQAQAAGVEFIACQMTMEMMGIAQEELLDGVTIGGVATYMSRAEEANVNLFI